MSATQEDSPGASQAGIASPASAVARASSSIYPTGPLTQVISWFCAHHSMECFYCGRALRSPASAAEGVTPCAEALDARGTVPRTIDHVIPRSAGGGSGLRNMVPACRDCNLAKGRASLEEFRAAGASAGAAGSAAGSAAGVAAPGASTFYAEDAWARFRAQAKKISPPRWKRAGGEKKGRGRARERADEKAAASTAASPAEEPGAS